MSILFVDSLKDELPIDKWGAITGVPTVSTLYGKNDKGVRLGDNTGTGLRTKDLGTPATIIVAGWIKVVDDTGGSLDILMSGHDDTGINHHWWLSHDPINDRLHAYGGGSLKGSTANGTFITGGFYHVAVKVLVHASAGTFDIEIDGVSALSLSGIDTYQGDGAFTAFVWIGGQASSDVNEMNISDIVISDTAGPAPQNDFLGVVRVEGLLPNANGTTSNQTGSDGNQVDNHLLVDEEILDTADYVESDTEGDLDLYGLANLASSGVDVFGVQITGTISKDAAGAKHVRPLLRTGGANYTGTSMSAPETVYTTIQDNWDLNPDTGLAWTPTQIDALEAGTEVRDS